MKTIELKPICDRTEAELLDDEFLRFIFSGKDAILKTRVVEEIRERAKQLGCLTKATALLNVYKNAAKKQRSVSCVEADFYLHRNDMGEVTADIGNFERIIAGDRYFDSIRYNMLTLFPERRAGQVWTDFDDTNTFSYIHTKYGIYNPQMCLYALNNIFASRPYHPVREKIEGLQWDGEERIEKFLIEKAGCEDTPYIREVSRLIFAGGIHRIYEPGCKFDSVAVLVGGQGQGKSSLVRWLAMEDEFFGEVNTMEGKEGAEALAGKWICELSELIAVTKSREVEAVKSYLSRQSDFYRRAYERRPTDFKRQCIFIGTTNREQFLSDKTGNRRFFPVKVGITGEILFKSENATKEYIKQCWAEAKFLYDEKRLPPYPDYTLIQDIKKAQEEATEFDYRIDLIKAYIEGKDKVCVLQIWENALNEKILKPTKKDSTEIGLIMQQMEGWKRCKNPIYIENYGNQRGWSRL